MRLLYLLPVLLLLLPSTSRAQARHNLNFEPEANHHQPLLLWMWGTRGAATPNDAKLRRVDTLTRAASGRGSLLIDVSQTEEPVSGAVSTSITPVDSLRWQTVTISGQLRTQQFVGKAYLYAYAQTSVAGENLAGNDNFNSPAAPLTSGWQRVQIQLPVPQATTNLRVGLRFQGQGRVWLDDVRVEWNNGQQRYHDQLLPGTEPPVLTAAARRPNWDFERAFPPLQDPRYQARLDSLTPAQHGKRSLHLTAVGPGRSVGYLGQVPLYSSLRGKTLVVKGYIRGSSKAPGAAFAYCLLTEDSRFGPRWGSADAVRELPLPPEGGPTVDWQPFAVAIPITWNKFVTQVALGMSLNAGTSVWIDNLQLLVDGKPYAPPADPAAVALPTATELAWLRKAALPLRTVIPDGGDVKDLAPFGALVTKAQIIGLGEVSYGSREIAQLRHRLTRYLIEQKGVRTIALEADRAVCLALNDYLRTGQGNPRQLLGKMGAYNSAETLALVQWLRAFNERAAVKVHVGGLECQLPSETIAYLRELLPRTATALHTQLEQLGQQLQALPGAGIRLNPFTEPTKTDPRLTLVRTTLQNVRAGLEERVRLQAGGGLMLEEAAIQQQLLLELEQYVTLQTLDLELAPTYRATSLAQNIHWLHSQPNSATLIVLAHNHVLDATATTGRLLRATYGPNYVALASAFGRGSFRTTDPQGRFAMAEAATAEPGSYEYYFRTATTTPILLDLRHPSLSPGTQWLYQNLLLRDVEHTVPRSTFLRHDLRREFDALLYLPTSTPLRSIP
ncbi:erythromycin esterase family protein [Hymenobacter mucosus]|uniref:Erythromycin esterase n=1 Tax=Hymenobacter mucosus TaxID=1411120 RepID=A0A238XR22_9BACT|nr:erythromycin esterase family protein [Hymenobacter mucosus]SNR61397.1 erythromycin esterase [Hymenobacter mucosus]